MRRRPLFAADAPQGVLLQQIHKEALGQVLCVVALKTTATQEGVDWSMVHHFGFFTGPDADHGELCFLYIAVFLVLAVIGAGRYSLDTFIARKFYD